PAQARAVRAVAVAAEQPAAATWSTEGDNGTARPATPAARPTAITTPTRRTAAPAGAGGANQRQAAVADVLQLLALVVGENLVELIIHFFLQFLHLFLLFRGQLQRVLERRRQHLAGLLRTKPEKPSERLDAGTTAWRRVD